MVHCTFYVLKILLCSMSAGHGMEFRDLQSFLKKMRPIKVQRTYRQSTNRHIGHRGFYIVLHDNIP